ncbi:MAG: M20/M25/M40 family metallo-hydrolase [Bacteroidetes bacterium]|nr:M20/M25/M40 family metallo-hydrolase [Bacteroidota bacterium]
MKILTFIPVLLFTFPLLAQNTGADTAVISRIIREGTDRSGVMQTASYLTDVYGPRLTGSPDYDRAAEWTLNELKRYGLENVKKETFGPFGKGWSLKRFYLHAMEPVSFPVIGVPKAWSPAVKGVQKAEVVWLNVKSREELETYRGKLAGKLVMISDPVELKPGFKPDASRHSDSTLLVLSNADPKGTRNRSTMGQVNPAISVRDKFEFVIAEKALATIEPSRGDDGTVFSMGAYVVQPENVSWDQRIQAYSPGNKTVIPQVVIAAENYNRWVRMIGKGQTIRAEMVLEVSFTEEKDGYNLLAEIPGTDYPEEVVMLGGHFDSWHGGTGATDNASGVAVAMEAMRLLKEAGVRPKRTIRIALWGGEEQGLLGSRGYVKKNLGERLDKAAPWDSIRYQPAGEKFSVYFNMDNGTGKFRGIYMEGNETARPLFRDWLKPFATKGAATLSPLSTGGTDHMAFNAIGLPGFQFIQDPIEYFAKTWHSNMDVYDKLIEDDLKHNSMVMAVFVYQAAMMEGLFPRKPLN